MPSTIPFDLIHKLEEEKGSLSNVSDDDRNLAEIQRIANPSKDEAIIELINSGYSVEETVMELNCIQAVVRKVIYDHGLILYPKFRYLMIDGYGQSLYVANLRNLRRYSRDTNFMKLKKALNKLGAKLFRFDNHWFDLERGDNYMKPGINDNVFVK